MAKRWAGVGAVQESVETAEVMGNMLQGYVDSVSPDMRTLTGWVEVRSADERPNVFLARGSARDGLTSFGEQRADVLRLLGISNRSFTLTLDHPLDPGLVLTKAHAVLIESDGAPNPLQLGGRAVPQLMADFVRTISAETKGTREAVLEVLNKTGKPTAAPLVKYAHESVAAGRDGDLSYLGFPVGLRSGDDLAQIGRDGHLFLTGGTNALRDQYKEPHDESEVLAMEVRARKWEAALADSGLALAEMGIPFLTTIIPEKLTALRKLAPLPIDGPTPLYRRLLELLRETPYHLDVLPLFETWECHIEAWQKNDTHCSPAGSLAITRAILDRLPGIDRGLVDDVALSDLEYRNGDLAGKFFDIPLWDRQYRPAPDALGPSRIENVYSYSPGNFVGSHNIWENSLAPNNKKVVVFGNSFFSGVESPTRLGWWFSRLFREYHMKWDNAVDLDYVRDVRPDYVIFQTIERFLVRPPGQKVS
ncbi:hypothetical protein PTW37_10310 [Arthrobacter agilis]|uniref:alginate O-acetyltransferase AlgX-related protein n=1 Tax=Arthrobacter agilis TaxID=37921 RepID=UPI002366FBA0|nr:hypothetical protein [Arthrobacter agilis]WDF32267.1 hypothetical protein PTW37_10310 [Arthrobacter agilis]